MDTNEKNMENEEFNGLMLSKLVKDLVNYLVAYGDMPICVDSSDSDGSPNIRIAHTSLVIDVKPEDSNAKPETFVLLTSDDVDI